jgi:hypothetical protein
MAELVERLLSLRAFLNRELASDHELQFDYGTGSHKKKNPQVNKVLQKTSSQK